MVKNNQQLLHFTFSPVQGFVSQARRTRDLWAGSYLLSWLSGQAMRALIEDGGNIIMPDIKEDALLTQIYALKEIDFNDPASYLGSLPNRFTAVVPKGIDGQICTDAIENSWGCVTGAVYDLIQSTFNEESYKIWQRQTENFWECTWVIGEKMSLLDQRKNFRIHLPPQEPGEKCTVCGERQELSGELFPNRKTINTWWKQLAASNTEIHGLDLKENERLCSICITKRLFPRVAQKAIQWEVPEFYPSTAYMSAIDWIINVLELADKHDEIKKAASDLLGIVQTNIVKNAEKKTWAKIRGIEEGIKKQPVLKQFLYIDGSVFYQDTIQNLNFKLENRGQVASALKQLQQAIQKQNIHAAKASPFYALLLMDGDNMGKLLGKDKSGDRRKKISTALSQFTKTVPKIVRDNNGMLLYAGGDDVFALLPVSTAMECARLCRIAYQCSFKEHAPFVSVAHATISAAVQYVHMNTALGVVVRDAHSLLDDTAKDKTGRDAIACRVWKRGGPILTWAQPWQTTDEGILVETVQKAFSDDSTDPDKFSSKFFYKLHNLFEQINNADFTNNKNDIIDILAVEYLSNREHDWPSDKKKDERRAIATDRVKNLLRLCRQNKRTVTTDNEIEILSGKYSAAGAMLVRFLTQKEV